MLQKHLYVVRVCRFMPPKVLVGCPTAIYKEYCLDEYARAVTSLRYGNYDIMVVDNSETDEYKQKIEESLSRSNKNNISITVVKDKFLERAKDRIVHSRNLVREHAIKSKYDYFLSLEQDVIPPSDVIEQLLTHQKHVTSGLYFTEYDYNNEKVVQPLVWLKDATGKLQFVNQIQLEQPRLLRVHASGLGCVLVKRTILEQFPFRLFDDRSTYDDMPFYYDLFMRKIPVFLDTGVKCKHFIKGMNWDVLKE